MERMKQIKIPKVHLDLTYEEVNYINDLILRDTELESLQAESDGYKKCPSCRTVFFAELDFCPKCGQRVGGSTKDFIPFEDMEDEVQ